LTLKVKFLL